MLQVALNWNRGQGRIDFFASKIAGRTVSDSAPREGRHERLATYGTEPRFSVRREPRSRRKNGLAIECFCIRLQCERRRSIEERQKQVHSLDGLAQENAVVIATFDIKTKHANGTKRLGQLSRQQMGNASGGA